MFEVLGFILLYFLFGIAIIGTLYVLDKNDKFFFSGDDAFLFMWTILFWPLFTIIIGLCLLFNPIKLLLDKLKDRIWDKNG